MCLSRRTLCRIVHKRHISSVAAEFFGGGGTGAVGKRLNGDGVGGGGGGGDGGDGGGGGGGGGGDGGVGGKLVNSRSTALHNTRNEP